MGPTEVANFDYLGVITTFFLIAFSSAMSQISMIFLAAYDLSALFTLKSAFYTSNTFLQAADPQHLLLCFPSVETWILILKVDKATAAH